MKIMVITMPCFGDTVPMLGFMEELTKRGHQVDLVSSTYSMPKIRDYLKNTSINFIDFDVERLENYQPGREVTIWDTAEVFSLQIEDVSNKAEEYDAVIYDYFAFPMYQLLKDKKVCSIRYFANFAFNETIRRRMFESDEKDSPQTKHALYVGGEQMSARGVEFRYGNFGEEIVNNVPDLTIVHTLKELQPYGEEFSEQFAYVGACATPPAEEKCEIPFDQMKGKIIYVSFGTIQSEMGDGRMGVFRMIMEALRDEDVSVIIAMGWKHTLEDFGNVPENVYLYSFVPQAEVLQHADLFIMHCGMNSTNDAVYYGVPMIGIPGGYDQPLTAELLEKRGMGKEIKLEDVTVDCLRETIFDILVNKEIYDNVKALSAKMRSVDCDKRTADLIEEYIEKGEKTL